jgi:hypothetical protein
MSNPSGEVRSVSLPWYSDNPVPANMAIGNIRENLMAWLTIGRGIHAETLLSVTGSLAGYAGQMAIWQNYIIPKRPLPPNGFMPVETTSGETFYFGDLLNGFLVPQSGNDFPIWMFVAGAAVTNGVAVQNLPDTGLMFKHAASSLGSPEYDILNVPKAHLPHMPPRQSLEVFWLSICKLMTMGFSPHNEPLPAPKPEHWPIILGLVAQQYIVQTKEVLDPALAVQIVMQSAIIASKYDGKSLKFRPPH